MLGYAVEAYQSRLMNKDAGSFYILSVDGGGFRGLYAAHILRRMEEEWQLDWKSQFGMLAGTSTGAILVAGLLCGRTAAELSEFYKTRGESIFTPRSWSFLDPLKVFRSRYSIARLEKQLDEIFGDITLGKISTPLILPAVDIGNGCVHMFKSTYDNSFVRDRQVRVAKAVLASCAAPLYFDPIIMGDLYQLADGGIWANNPSLVATIEAHYRLRISLEKIRVLSIGTGKSKAFYPLSHGKWKDRLCRPFGWGLLTRWQRVRLIDLIRNLQSDTAHNMLCLLLGESPLDPKNVLRVTFESDRPLPMDCTNRGKEWISRADHDFTRGSHKIRTFLNEEAVI